MKKIAKYSIAAAMALLAAGGANAQTAKQNWGDYKLWIDPGHSMKENQGLYHYSEAEKVLRVALATREYLKTYTTIEDSTTLRMTRHTDEDNVSLEERSDLANAWGADFFYAIHSDAGSNNNQTLFLFGGWYENGTPVEKTPNGGKRFAEILDPNLTGVMYKTTSRGSWYDRYFYDRVTDHSRHYPYLSVNRRTNCASMLSEGGFHTISTQQALNINDSYKRLEGFGTFRAIMQFRGLDRPEKVMLAGVVTNAETDEPLNNVTVTVDRKTVVTDSYESLFKNYTNNPDLIHNGFFLFEGLNPDTTGYTITYSCPGFDSATNYVTLANNPQGLSGENVTWANVALTSNVPAVVSSINIDNAQSVSKRDPIILTFSRKMDQKSVEQAFSLADGVTLKWDNEYRLRIDINKLDDETQYTLKIDGSIAKNSQTNQLLDGNGDGTEGGDYTFTFTTAPTDNEAPYIVSTTPADNSTMLYTLMPAIRVEFNEELNWNEDAAADVIKVEDADGNHLDGTITHAVVNGASVLHFYPADSLTRDKAYKVTVAGGLTDIAGNKSESKVFRFLSEYRTVQDQFVLDECVTGHWWTPDGSGSTVGTTSKTGKNEGSTTLTQATMHSSKAVANTLHLHYEFDNEAAAWQIRQYRKEQQNNYFRNYPIGSGYVLQAAVYGDGSNNQLSHMVRILGDGLKRNVGKKLDFRGWDMMAWDFDNNLDNIEVFTGNKTSLAVGDVWCYDSFFLKHTMTAEQGDLYEENNGMDEEDNPIEWQDWTGDVYVDDYKVVKYGNETQTASVDDLNTSVDEIEASDITINNANGMITVIAPDAIESVAVYAVNGVQMAGKAPAATQATVSMQNATPGVYVVKVVTANKTTTKRIIVK